MQKRVVILGSTGSIGRATLEVAAAMPERVRIVGLAAGERWQELAQQARAFAVPVVAVADERLAADLRAACPAGTRVLAGQDGLVELISAAPDANFVMSAIVGAAGLRPTLEAVERGLDVALANKESLVVAGSLLMPLVRRRGSALIPVDSEHSAVFQALHSGRREEVARIYLTASGGPFRTWPLERIETAALSDALNHPTWNMGPKITIDSATMMNKALEVVEATHLFGLAAEQIEVLIHPQSIVHSMVEFRDGSVLAQLGTPDMRTPIQYALTYPQRSEAAGSKLSWREARRLEFEPPDPERFPALELGFEAARAGGTMGAVLNAANEAAVQLFRDGRIGFGRIVRAVEQVMSRHTATQSPALEQLLAADAWARQEVIEWTSR